MSLRALRRRQRHQLFPTVERICTIPLPIGQQDRDYLRLWPAAQAACQELLVVQTLRSPKPKHFADLRTHIRVGFIGVIRVLPLIRVTDVLFGLPQRACLP